MSVLRLSAEIPVVQEQDDAGEQKGREEEYVIPPIGVVHDATLLSITIMIKWY
jgi:hypothetical protein